MFVFEQATYTFRVCSATVLQEKIPVFLWWFFHSRKKLSCYTVCVVHNLLVAVMRTLPQIIMPPDSLTHHVAMCVVPLATYVQCWMKWNAHISQCILSATNVLLQAKRRGQEVLDLQEGKGKLLSLDCRTFLEHMVCLQWYLRSLEPISFVHSVVCIFISSVHVLLKLFCVFVELVCVIVVHYSIWFPDLLIRFFQYLLYIYC